MNDATPLKTQDTIVPGFFRRLAAIVYDCILMAAVLFFAAAIVYVPLKMGFGIEDPSDYPAYFAYLVAVCAGFFSWFWTHGGQTLGMCAWRIRVIRDNGLPLRWRDALLRMASALLSWAILGLGFLWVLVDSDRLAWHDRLSKTRLILLEKQPRKPT